MAAQTPPDQDAAAQPRKEAPDSIKTVTTWEQVLRKYAELDARLKVLETKNSGGQPVDPKAGTLV